MNTVTLIGNIGNDINSRTFESGKSVASFSLGTNERWTDHNGQRVERVDWHTIVCWNGLATLATKYLSKGRKIAVTGRLQYREYTNKDGFNVRVAEVIANTVEFLDKAPAKHEAEVIEAEVAPTEA